MLVSVPHKFTKTLVSIYSALLYKSKILSSDENMVHATFTSAFQIIVELTICTVNYIAISSIAQYELCVCYPIIVNG